SNVAGTTSYANKEYNGGYPGYPTSVGGAQMGSNNQNVAGAYEGYGSKANSGGYPGEVAGAYGYSNQNVAGAYEGFGNKGNGYPGAVA
ncbi:hypothetical protein R0J91_17510, partial [Micrococcus sp. SIMBA_131]